MRIILVLEYDGSRYCGWQSQPAMCSVQDALEQALSKIACTNIRVITAGRTDTGVHALYQVVHFDTQVKRPLNAWVRGVNSFLPDDIAVLWASEADDEFHARYSATERHYIYALVNQPVRPGLLNKKVGWFHQPLDLQPMQQAAATLLGKHDFSSFRAAECQAKSPVREITKLDISRQGHMFVVEFSANAFLHHMVRNIAGVLIEIGCGNAEISWMDEILEIRDRTKSAKTAPADGLYLTMIEYPEKYGIPVPANSRCAIPAVATV